MSASPCTGRRSQQPLWRGWGPAEVAGVERRAQLRRARDWVEHSLQVEGRVNGGTRVNRAVAGAGVIGGLLSAYDASGDPVLLARARQLADHLLHVSRGAATFPSSSLLQPPGSACHLAWRGSVYGMDCVTDAGRALCGIAESCVSHSVNVKLICTTRVRG